MTVVNTTSVHVTFDVHVNDAKSVVGMTLIPMLQDKIVENIQLDFDLELEQEEIKEKENKDKCLDWDDQDRLQNIDISRRGCAYQHRLLSAMYFSLGGKENWIYDGFVKIYE